MTQRTNIKIKANGTIFSPGNSRAVAANKGYDRCVDFWAKSGYTLRYSGCMAADCYHIFIKGQGIFSSVSAVPPKYNPKLRVLYECLPIGFLIVKAGGMASDGVKDLLDLRVTGYTQRCDIIIGSSQMVEQADKFLAEDRAS